MASAILPPNRVKEKSVTKKIIVIEDEPLMRKNLTRMLENRSFEVLEASDGLEGLDVIEKSRPDLILCDVVMPRLDGFDLLRKVKSRNETALTPFILLSGKGDKTAVRQGMSLGADDYLVKPFTTEELVGSVDSQFTKRAAFQSSTYEKLVEKSNFVSSVMHDFRGPLSILMLTLDSLEEEKSSFNSPKRKEFYSDMRQQINQMSHMLEDLLVFGRLEHEDLPVRPAPVDLSALCRQVIKEILTLDRLSHPIKLNSKNLPASFVVDELLLRQIITNLLLNAVKYTPINQPVALRLYCDQNSVFIEIHDRGIGISTEDQQQILKPYWRGENAGGIRGSGFGLSIVKIYLNRLGGELQVKSKPGKGSCFTVRIPLNQKK